MINLTQRGAGFMLEHGDVKYRLLPEKANILASAVDRLVS